MPPGSHNGSDRSGVGGGRGSHQGRGSAQDKAENNGGEFGPAGYQGSRGEGSQPQGPSLDKAGEIDEGNLEKELQQSLNSSKVTLDTDENLSKRAGKAGTALGTS